MRVRRVVGVLLAIVLCAEQTQSASILGIFSYTFPTPYLVITPFVRALIDNGHRITIISTVCFLPDMDGVRHIRVPALDKLIYNITNLDFDFEVRRSKWKEVSMISTIFYKISYSILSDLGVQSLLKDEKEHFDMILMEPMHTYALFGIAEHFNAAQVGISAFSSSWMIDYLAGNSVPSVYRPIYPMGYSSGISLREKWQNSIYITEEWLIDQLIYLPRQVQLFRQFFPYSQDELYQRRRSFALILINQHFSLGHVRSNVPNVVEVAGIHLAQPMTPLDPELLRFMDEAEHGVIYFSMGLEILSKLLPKNLQKTFLETLTQLKQRVVWKHDIEKLPYKSDNIYINRLLPQRKILEHPNLKLFITHGGLLSLIEAAHSGVPVLGLPIYFDQFDNIGRLEKLGAAQSLDINELTVEQLTHSINELLHNPCYATKAKELSERFRDQPTSPMEKAVWWTEYVLRHKGAPHMRLDEQDISFVPYYSINIFSVLFGRIGISALIIIIFSYKLMNFLIKSFKRAASGPLYLTQSLNSR